MLSTLITGTAVMQAFAMRPAAKSGSVMLARLAETMQEHPADEMAAVTAASTIVNDVMLEAGNATEHLSADNQETLTKVMNMIKKVMYGSMNDADEADRGDLKHAIENLVDCNTNIAGLQSPTGLLGKFRKAAENAQKDLNGLSTTVMEKAALNQSAWTNFSDLMDTHDPPPSCPGLPARPQRTMPLLDQYFAKSEYKIWFAARQPVYHTTRDVWLAADQAHAEAIEAYNMQKAKLDVAYCDWKNDLEFECANFETCWATGVDNYNNLKARVDGSVQRRKAAFKAGETLIVQIKFLLAMKDSSETGDIDASKYTIAFKSLPEKEDCDMTPLKADIWNPPIDCEEQVKGECTKKCQQNNQASWATKCGWSMCSACSECSEPTKVIRGLR